MTIKDKVCPNLVDVDIGCGMYTIELLKCYEHLKDKDRLRRSLGTLGGGNHHESND